MRKSVNEKLTQDVGKKAGLFLLSLNEHNDTTIYTRNKTLKKRKKQRQ